MRRVRREATPLPRRTESPPTCASWIACFVKRFTFKLVVRLCCRVLQRSYCHQHVHSWFTTGTLSESVPHIRGTPFTTISLRSAQSLVKQHARRTQPASPWVNTLPFVPFLPQSLPLCPRLLSLLPRENRFLRVGMQVVHLVPPLLDNLACNWFSRRW